MEPNDAFALFVAAVVTGIRLSALLIGMVYYFTTAIELVVKGEKVQFLLDKLHLKIYNLLWEVIFRKGIVFYLLRFPLGLFLRILNIRRLKISKNNDKFLSLGMKEAKRLTRLDVV